MTLMNPSDEQPDQPTMDSELSFSTLEVQDFLVQAFRRFLQIELSNPTPKHIADVVNEFSRRVTFLTKIFDIDHLTDDLASQITGLIDAKMAELALAGSNGVAIRPLPQVRIFDNSDLSKPSEHFAPFVNGSPKFSLFRLNEWLHEYLAAEFYLVGRLTCRAISLTLVFLILTSIIAATHGTLLPRDRSADLPRQQNSILKSWRAQTA